MPTKPTLLTVDDEPDVLRAVERDLRRHYGRDYRILRAESGASALDTLRQLQQRDEEPALLLADQRMPHMSGVEFLAEARQLFPDAKRVLLTAYADTSAAIDAINKVSADYYLLKPWDPPEEHFYPVLDDLLEDWRSGYRPKYEGLRLLGHRWSPQSHELKDFLGRQQYPYRWYDIENKETDKEIQALLQAHPEAEQHLPFVVLPDGTPLEKPDVAQLADRIGMRTKATDKSFDLCIIGGGPAGLAAAVYGASEGLSTVMIDREAPGGQAGMSSRIENYLGFPSGLSGSDLSRRAVAQATRFGVEIVSPQEATGLCAKDGYREVTMQNGSVVSCRALLIATGVSWRRLEVPGLDRLYGTGVYYGAAMTEAMSCQDEDVFIIGGANSAGQGAMYFSKYAKRVVMLVRGDGLAKSMSSYLIDQIKETPNITVESFTELVEAKGADRLENVVTINRQTGETQERCASALFIFIGATPRTEWLNGVLPMDQHGFILSGPDLMKNGERPPGWTEDRDPYLLETGMPGVFVAGDTRHGSIKRVASSVGEGSIAVQFVHQYLSKVQ